MPPTASPIRSGVDSAPPAVRVLSAAAAVRLFPGWDPAAALTPQAAAVRLRLLAREVQARAPAVPEVTVVYQPDGAVFGLVPVDGGLHGFAAPGGAGQDPAAAALALATRLAIVTTVDQLAEVTAGYNLAAGRVPPVHLPAADPDVAPTRADEPGSVIGRLLATYRDDACRHIQVPGRVRPPLPAEVGRVTDGFLPLLFPGYHGPLPAERGFDSFVCRRASALQHRLARLARRALAFQAAARGAGRRRATYRRAADRAVVAFFDGLPQVRRTLDLDVRAAYKHDPALAAGDHHLVPLAYPGLYATAVHRLAHLLENLRVPYVPRMMAEYAHARTGIDIHPAARIGPGFFVDHGTGVVIGETVEIGPGCTVYQGATLGAKNFPTDEHGNLIRGAKRHPTVQGNSVIYAGASVLGGDVVVGHGSQVGANVWLDQTVPPESRVVIPAPLRVLDISNRAAAAGSDHQE